MKIVNLKQIGLTEGELRVYEALLQLGETTKNDLVKKSGVSSSKVYEVANRLREKGLISTVKKNGVTHFQALNPNRLKDYLQTKKNEIANEELIVDEILPALLAEYKESVNKTDIEVLYGWEGLKTAFFDVADALEKNDENYIFGASKGKIPEQMNILLSQYFKKVDQKGYRIKIIYNENVRGYEDRIGYFLKSKIHEIRFLDQNTFAELNIYKDTVLFMMLLEHPITIRIKNKEAADSCKQFFQIMWSQATP